MASLPIDLQEDEQVILRVRPHTIFLITRLLGVAIFGLVPVIALLALIPTVGEGLMIVAVIWGVLALIAAYIVWYRYQHNQWILTNQRLVDSLKKHWFHHHMVSTDLINVENMSISKSGILQTLFDYGNLRCETAGHEALFVLRRIHDPASVLDQVDSARDEARKRFGTMMTSQVT
ncbi:MAG: hypothetical protein KC496_02595 [Anaerolineae bacterium]|nr:hypothetical protein [Anaerolineae bacterium]